MAEYFGAQGRDNTGADHRHKITAEKGAYPSNQVNAGNGRRDVIASVVVLVFNGVDQKLQQFGLGGGSCRKNHKADNADSKRRHQRFQVLEQAQVNLPTCFLLFLRTGQLNSPLTSDATIARLKSGAPVRIRT